MCCFLGCCYYCSSSFSVPHETRSMCSYFGLICANCLRFRFSWFRQNWIWFLRCFTFLKSSGWFSWMRSHTAKWIADATMESMFEFDLLFTLLQHRCSSFYSLSEGSLIFRFGCLFKHRRETELSIGCGSFDIRSWVRTTSTFDLFNGEGQIKWLAARSV